ncbi:MAG: SH3 domain-containing protein [Phycisphaerales bacterium]
MRLVALITILFAASLAAAQTPTLADLTRAQDAYDRGIALKAEGKPEDARASFTEAGRLFGRVVESGADNAGLHFNLGNALVQSGELGRGIASYLRAQRIAPQDSAIAANLSTARSDVRTKLSGSAEGSFDTSFAWWRVVAARTRAIVSLVAWIAFWALVAPAILGKALPPSLRFARGAALATAILLGGSVALDRWMPTVRPIGVITTDGVVLRKGNGDGFAPQVEETLTNGVEFRVLERRPQWLRVRLSDGTEGWVRENQAEVV